MNLLARCVYSEFVRSQLLYWSFSYQMVQYRIIPILYCSLQTSSYITDISDYTVMISIFVD